MIYLLTLGWPWFAGALALGAFVGFLTFKPRTETDFSGGWVVVVGALALGAAGVASAMGLLAGRDALALDVALLAGLAYAAGLPLGGVLKPLLGGGAQKKTRPALAPVVVAPASASADPPPAPSRKVAPGAKPATLAAPRDGGPDDLTRIKGIGPRSLEKLYALGVFHYDQIAAWNLENARWIGAALGAPGRVERDKWIQQAKALAGAEMERG